MRRQRTAQAALDGDGQDASLASAQESASLGQQYRQDNAPHGTFVNLINITT
jgi:hypothetical protein